MLAADVFVCCAVFVSSTRGCRSLKFMVGPTEAPKFRMIERHYFRGTLVKSYDFEFGFCIPGSTNTWDAEYEMPPLDDALGKLRC